MMRWLEDHFIWLLVTLVALVMALLLAVIVWATYYAFTGGFTYTEKTRVGGVVCIEVHDRLTGQVESLSCPVRHGAR